MLRDSALVVAAALVLGTSGTYVITERHIAFVDAQSTSALDFANPGEPTQAESPVVVKFRRVDGDPLPR